MRKVNAEKRRLLNLDGNGVNRFINGMKAQGTPLKDARIVFYGAGSSAVGVATMIAQLLVKECGMTFDEAKKVQLLQHFSLAKLQQQSACITVALLGLLAHHGSCSHVQGVL